MGPAEVRGAGRSTHSPGPAPHSECPPSLPSPQHSVAPDFLPLGRRLQSGGPQTLPGGVPAWPARLSDLATGICLSEGWGGGGGAQAPQLQLQSFLN